MAWIFTKPFTAWPTKIIGNAGSGHSISVNRRATFISANPTIATVSLAGQVTLLKPGLTYIAVDEVDGAGLINVSVLVEGVIVAPPPIAPPPTTTHEGEHVEIERRLRALEK